MSERVQNRENVQLIVNQRGCNRLGANEQSKCVFGGGLLLCNGREKVFQQFMHITFNFGQNTHIECNNTYSV